MRPMISVRSLGKRFVLHNQGGVELPVLSDVSLDIRGGETLALRGPSGAGKSTLLRLVYGNYLPTTGEICILHNGEPVDMTRASPREIIDVRRRTLSYVSQFLRVIPRVATIDVVRYVMLARGVAEGESTRKARAILDRLNLPERLWSLPPATFSGGEQQRVNIARVFADPTAAILLDEPTASLDPVNREIVVDLINETRKSGSAMIGIFHDEDVRDRVATHHLDVSPYQRAA